MTASRPWKIAAGVASAWLLALLPALLRPDYLDSPARWLALPPFAIGQGLHALGLPGVLRNGGQCGWGWGAPTPSGRILAGLILLALPGLSALAAIRVRKRFRRPVVRHNGAPPSRGRP